ncbi:hypothetical protein N8I77_003023 [Diaporthe amygdali]|uniref:Uncharacterized protein n=1 Tax=Phomopsis amygdali TaxID=1214568 RepID=A0AAD9SI02_PHOAM|nr:hypothetical protein N8I77_003023 [Diaporthe amygdali]
MAEFFRGSRFIQATVDSNKAFGVTKLAKVSFDLVSNETQQEVEKFMDLAGGRLVASGFTPKAYRQRFVESMKNATERTVRMAVQAWKTDLAACTAELFVQRFVETMFYGVCNLLEKLMKNMQLSDNDTSTLGTRKNDEPEGIARRHGSRDDGQKMPLSSSITNSKLVQWTGVPLTAAEQQLMNTDLMNVIWNTKISERLKPDHGPGIFEVRILRDAAWSLLGKDINRVFALIALRGPIRLHTFQSGRFLHISLWIRRSQTEGEMGKVIHYSLVEMFRLLRQWSLQAQDSEKAQCLADFLEVWYR